jgi:pimeloyl-ACP methyl ester carboxylesterase/predicted RNA-binding protein with PIN domain
MRGVRSRNGVYGGWNHAGSHRFYVRVPTALKERADANGNGFDGDAPAYEGTPIVLVHGVGTSSRALKPLIRALGEARPVFAPDLPGFGLSEDPAHPLDVSELADALRHWLNENDLAPAILTGVSFGCQVAVDLAARHPELVERLILVGPMIDPNGRSPLRLATRWARGAYRSSPLRAPTAIHDVLDAGPYRTVRALKQALDDPIEDELPDVEAPTLVVRGIHDSLVPLSWAERVVELLPEGELASLAHAGHTVGPRRAESLAHLIDRFLKKAQVDDEPNQSNGHRPNRDEEEEAMESPSGIRWIVDGMNVIGARPDGWWRDRPAAWRRLARGLERYAHHSGDEIRLILDGRRPDDWEEDGVVEIGFANGGPDAADDAIVGVVAADPDPEGLRVVTSDRALARRVRELGAEVVGAGEFRHQIAH